MTDAWYAACDGFFLEQGEWDDKNESRLKVKLLATIVTRGFAHKREQQGGAARLTDAGLLSQQFFQQFVPLRGEWIHHRHAVPGKSFLHIFR